MNDDFPIDPALRSLEAHLSALRPKLLDREARELLYQCGFAAGQKLAASRTRRWRIAAAALAAFMLAAGIFLLNDRVLVARRTPTTVDPAASVLVPTPHHGSRPLSGLAAVPLDAWQARADTAAAFESALARFKQRDANSRSLAVGTILRAAGTVP